MKKRVRLWLTTLWLRLSVRMSAKSFAQSKQRVEDNLWMLDRFCGRSDDDRHEGLGYDF